MSTTATRIRQISLVCVPTPDQDRAIEFYESMGFEKRTDVPFGGNYRWVEVYPPEGTTGIDAMRAMENDAVDGLVLLGARIRTTSVATSDLPRGAGVPRLFITGAGIADAVTDAARLRANAIGWAAEVSLPTAQQGTTLLEGDWALDVREQILGFIREQRFLTRTRIRKASMLGTAAGPIAHTSSEPVTGGDG